MPYRTCDHLKEDGVYCSSPALRDQRYCYFHLNARARRVQAAQAQLHLQPCRLNLPILDNMHAVQGALQQVIDALADGRIETRRAALLLYGLQQAASGLKTTPEWKGQRPEVAADQPLRALEANTLRDQYGLPFDVDLDAPPEVAAAIIDATATLTPAARHDQTQQQRLARVPPPRPITNHLPPPARVAHNCLLLAIVGFLSPAARLHANPAASRRSHGKPCRLPKRIWCRITRNHWRSRVPLPALSRPMPPES